MRAPLLASLLLLGGTSAASAEDAVEVQSGARCQTARPASALLGSPRQTLRAKVHVGSAHGCSQSEASQSIIAEIALSLSNDKAQLSIESFENKSFGPSPGRYRQGDRNFHHDSIRWRWRFSGVAKLADHKLLLQLDQVETSVDRSGGINYQETTRSAAGKTLTCTEDTVAILPSFEKRKGTDGAEQPRCEPVVTCRGLFELIRIPFESLTRIAPRVLIDGALPLLPGPGLDIDTRHFHSSDWAHFRHASK